MSKPCPREFRDDVVAVARQGRVPLRQVARDFGNSDIEDGNRNRCSSRRTCRENSLPARR
ncbi:hypothetical protein BS329_16935 [Amycolatopsis coloradensis]|uniref:Transposase n=1 Tax=Amycolatopsis coloradensis TaxID=76021 RepID=A0A1R0KTT7_9PSEU|nr:hypothetical protein [Amycolatopsis coloradensis]OLZ51465.1 hypothetical protein BS329_16935 [Amycolatopsis coloradensis]